MTKFRSKDVAAQSDWQTLLPNKDSCGENDTDLTYLYHRNTTCVTCIKNGLLIYWTVRCMNRVHTIYFIRFLYHFIIYFRVSLFIWCKWNWTPLDSLHFYLHPISNSSVPLTAPSRCLILKILKTRRDKNKHITFARHRFSLLYRATRNFRNIAQNGSRL
jgi:hypothetical protein